MLDAGKWLFRQRGWLPIPLVAFLTLIHTGETSSLALTWAPGTALIVLGLALRFWAVGYISPQSRTYTSETWYLVREGPYAFSRNPLYVANILVWAGVTAMSRLVWLVPIASLLAIVEYSLIVRWEESNLASRFGRPYELFRSSTPRWLPSMKSLVARISASGTYGCEAPDERHIPSRRFSWRMAVQGEVHTWISVGASVSLMVMKQLGGFTHISPF